MTFQMQFKIFNPVDSMDAFRIITSYFGIQSMAKKQKKTGFSCLFMETFAMASV